MDADATIRALQQALAQSPDNTPLRRHLAETLSAYGHYQDAEQELLLLLKQEPKVEATMLLLARAYRAQDKNSAAHVVLEQLVEQGGGRARV